MNAVPDQALAVAEKLRRLEAEIAQEATEAFYRQHPEWPTLFSEAGRTHSLGDAAVHIDLLATAVQIGSVEAFQGYLCWMLKMLEARNIPASCVDEQLQLIEGQLKRRLTSREWECAAPYLAVPVTALRRGESPRAESAAPWLSRAQAAFLRAILTGKRKAALGVALDALAEGYEPQTIYVQMFQASLQRVGQLWEENQITVADEHMATAITQFVIAQVYSRIPAREVCCGNVVIAGVEGELHQVGANIVADMLEIEGFDVRFLGTNIPDSDIVAAVEAHEADVLGISATMLFSLPNVGRLINRVARTLGERAPRMVVGGAAFRFTPSLFRAQNVEDAVFDVGSAVDVIERGPLRRSETCPSGRNAWGVGRGR